MFCLPGAPALSQFRLERLLQALQGVDPRVRALGSRLVHFVDAARALDEAEQELLGKLLTYGPRPHLQEERGQRLLVTPRLGTVSPWSSKASDIAHVCGLEAVRRLERGTAYVICLGGIGLIGASQGQRQLAELVSNVYHFRLLR